MLRRFPPPSPAVEQREVAVLRQSPSTPVVLHREVTMVRQAPLTPAREHREVTALQWSPSTPHLEYRASPTTSHRSLASAQQASPVARALWRNEVLQQAVTAHGPVQHTEVQQERYIAAGGRGAALPTASPMCCHGRPLRAVAESSGGYPVTIDDETIQNAVAMLPPSPGNTLFDFLAGVVSGDIEPAMYHPGEARIDALRYWEKRRVQNYMRRVLEALQECFAADGEVAVADLGGKAFDAALARAPNTGRTDTALTGSLDEAAFIQGFEAMGAWPPELSAADRCEVFVALRVPSGAAVRALSAGQPLPPRLTRRMFCEGLARVPFNVPDFPVPTHLLRSNIHVMDVADAVARVFCREQTGLERVKDFFCCGLLSLEEIQAALPFHAAARLVQDAVTNIIRAGAAHFTMREWQTLVFAARAPPPEEEELPEITEEGSQSTAEPQGEHVPSLASPVQQYRQVPAASQAGSLAPAAALLLPTHGGDGASPPISTEAAASFEAMPQTAPEGAASRPQPSPAPLVQQSEPPPCREIRSEEPARFRLGQGHHAVNWSSTSPCGRSGALGLDRGHQADQGAGTSLGQQQQQQQGLSVFASPGILTKSGGEDLVRLISMDMHNECLGPFLALAFVRCCQLYEAR